MATIEQTLADKLHALTPEHLRSVEHFVGFLLDQQQRAELEVRAVANGWPAGYFERTAGSIPDFPDVPRDGWGVNDEDGDELEFDLPEDAGTDGAAR